MKPGTGVRDVKVWWRRVDRGATASRLMALSAANLLLLLLSTVAMADDWPQWNGPERNGEWKESGILESIPADGLKVLWRADVAGGYSGPAVADGKVVVTDFLKQSGDSGNDPEKRNELVGEERVHCFDAATGKLLWQVAEPCEYKISYPAGPRTTPTMDGGRVYTLGAEGRLQALNLADGKVVWKRELKTDYGIEAPIWGFCGHPLIDGDRLICLVGGQGSVVVAFNKHTGEEIWRALEAKEPGYSPPVMISTPSGPQLVVWHSESIQGLDPATGEVYWSKPLKPNYGMAIMGPRQSGDLLFASGIGSVGALFKLAADGRDAEVVWEGQKDTAIYCGNSTPILQDGVIYGSDCQMGNFRAVDLATGKRLWETFVLTTGGNRRESSGTAFLTRQGDRYWIFTEKGDLVLVRLSAEKFEELGRAHVIDPTAEAFGRSVAWTYPAFANRAMYVRNDKELICVSLAAQP